MTNGRLMKVKNIAECSKVKVKSIAEMHLAIVDLKTQFLVFFLSGRIRQV